MLLREKMTKEHVVMAGRWGGVINDVWHCYHSTKVKTSNNQVVTKTSHNSCPRVLSMADTSEFVTGDDFISFDFGDPANSPGPSRSSSASPGPLDIDSLRPNPKGKERAHVDGDGSSESGAASSTLNKKKRKGEPAGSAEKRVKTKKSPQPRPADEQTGPRNLKEERRARERGAPWAHDVNWRRCHDPAEM